MTTPRGEGWKPPVNLEDRGTTTPEIERIRAVQETIRNIPPTHENKWGILFYNLRELGGVQGSQGFYSADDLIQLINRVREGQAKISTVTSGGALGLYEKVASFLEADKSKVQQVEVSQEKAKIGDVGPGDRVKLNGVGATVEFVNHQASVFVAKDTLSTYQSLRPEDKDSSSLAFRAVKGSPMYKKFVENSAQFTEVSNRGGNTDLYVEITTDTGERRVISVNDLEK